MYHKWWYVTVAKLTCLCGCGEVRTCVLINLIGIYRIIHSICNIAWLDYFSISVVLHGWLLTTVRCCDLRLSNRQHVLHYTAKTQAICCHSTDGTAKEKQLSIHCQSMNITVLTKIAYTGTVLLLQIQCENLRYPDA